MIDPNTIKAGERFDPGEELVLTPYPLSDPYGIDARMIRPSDYVQGPSSQIPAPAPTVDFDFVDEADPGTRVRTVTKERLSNSSTIFLCRVEEAPTRFGLENGHARHLAESQLVVVKVQRAHYGQPTGRPEDQSYHARDLKELSPEAMVYQHLYDKRLTGHPHLAPQYYGTWALAMDGWSGRTALKDRYVGVIVLEYIDGLSLKQMCSPLRQEWYVVPRKGPIHLHRNATMSLDMGLNTRMRVLKQLFDGVARQVHQVVFQPRVSLRRVLVTSRNNGVDLDVPRVALIDYSFATVFSLTKAGMEYGGPHPVQESAKPPQPLSFVFSEPELINFAGWFPLEWEVQKPHGLRRWLVSKSGFGPLRNNENYFVRPEMLADAEGYSVRDDGSDMRMDDDTDDES